MFLYCRPEIVMLGLLWACAAAHAQGHAAHCLPLTSATERLACYDSALGRNATTAVGHATAPAPPRSTLSTRWDLDGPEGAMFAPRPYRPVY